MRNSHACECFANNKLSTTIQYRRQFRWWALMKSWVFNKAARSRASREHTLLLQGAIDKTRVNSDVCKTFHTARHKEWIKILLGMPIDYWHYRTFVPILSSFTSILLKLQIIPPKFDFIPQSYTLIQSCASQAFWPCHLCNKSHKVLNYENYYPFTSSSQPPKRCGHNETLTLA